MSPNLPEAAIVVGGSACIGRSVVDALLMAGTVLAQLHAANNASM